MTPEAVSALKSFFSSLWTLLGSIQIPGTFLTGQHLLVAPLGAVVFITALKKILDIGAVSDSVKASYQGGWEFDPGNKGQED